MRVVPCMVLMICVCLALAGCELFNRRPAGSAFAPGSAQVEPTKRAESTDPITGMKGESASTGFLAGQVINGKSGQPTKAFIRWVCLDDAKDKEEAAPIDMESQPDGYFTIQGLKAGKHYKLMARTEQGNQMLAGISFNQAPDIHVVIKVRADMASPTTPPIPAPPAYQPPKKNETKKNETKKDETSANTQPSTGMAQQASAKIEDWSPGPPSVQIQVPNAPPVVPTTVAPTPPEQRWDGPNFGKPMPPADPSRIAITQIPQKPPAVAIKIKAPVPYTDDLPRSWGTAPPPPKNTTVPSCVLVANRLVNFALRDLNGNPWVYKERKRGKLTLLDFWGTHCPPCRQWLPGLVAVQNKYGPKGLEVIGIACEQGGTAAEQGQRVAALAAKSGVNYPLLLSGGTQCPVSQNFLVTSLPTLILVDETGWICWRHVGPPDQKDIDTLNRVIQDRLPGGN